MKNHWLLFIYIPFFLFFLCQLSAQVSITIDGSQADPSSMLDLKSTSKGFLLPRLSQIEIEAIQNPANGLQVFCTTDDKIYIYISPESKWKEVQYASGSIFLNFNCGSLLLDTRDNKTYSTVLIGTQCWMKENLNIGTRIDGINDQTNNPVIEKYCYDNLESNCDVYGGFYQWGEMMNYAASSNLNPSGVQGICPTGWHVPSDEEWCQMEVFLDASVNCSAVNWRGTDAGGKMKETGTVHWISPNNGATNTSGFTAIAGGYRGYTGGFADILVNTYYWTSYESTINDAWMRHLYHNYATIDRSLDTKLNGFSVRCVKD